MNFNYGSILRRLGLFGVAAAFLSVTASAQINEADRIQRCENNRARVAALESELEGSMSNDELAHARQAGDEVHRIYALMEYDVWTLSNAENGRAVAKSKEEDARYNAVIQSKREEYDRNLANAKAIAAQYDLPLECRPLDTECVNKLHDALAARIRYEASHRAQREQAERELARHNTNLVALRCDEPAAPTGPHWVDKGVSDCSGNDIGTSTGLTPGGECKVGQVAVCWDGTTHRNAYGESHDAPEYPWCTYKSVASCGGGSNPGEMFRCET